MASGNRNQVQNDSQTFNDGGDMEYMSSSSNAMGVWHTLEVMVGQNNRRNLNYEGYNNDPNSNQFNIFTAIRRNDSLNEHFQSTTTGRKNSSAEMANSDGRNGGRKDVVSGSAKVSENSNGTSAMKKNVHIQVRKKKAGKGGKKVCRDKYEDLGVDCR